MKFLVCVSIVMVMLLLADVTAAYGQQRTPADMAAGSTQQTYLRGNTNASAKKEAMVAEEMHLDDPSFDTIFSNDYQNGSSPSANCKRNCRPRP